MMFDHPPVFYDMQTNLEAGSREIATLRSNLDRMKSVTGPIDLLVYPAGAGDAVHLAYARNLLIYDQAPFMHTDLSSYEATYIQNQAERILFLYFHQGFEYASLASKKEVVPTMLASLALLGLNQESARIIRYRDLQGLEFKDKNGPRYILYRQVKLNVWNNRIIDKDMNNIYELVSANRNGILVKGDSGKKTPGIWSQQEFDSYIVADPPVKIPRYTAHGKEIRWSSYYVNAGAPTEKGIFFGYTIPRKPLRLGIAQK